MKGILLAATVSSNGGSSTQAIVSTIIALLVLAGMGYLIYSKIKNSKDGSKILSDFLTKIQDTLKKAIIDAINGIDFTNITSGAQLDEYITKFLQDLYKNLWELCSKEVSELYSSDAVTAALLEKMLSQENIQKYIDTIFTPAEIKDKIEEAFTTYLTANLAKSKENEARLEAKLNAIDDGTIKDVEGNYVQFSEDDPKPVGNEVKEDAPETIIPPSDEEEVIKSDDGSVEILESEDKKVDGGDEA